MSPDIFATYYARLRVYGIILFNLNYSRLREGLELEIRLCAGFLLTIDLAFASSIADLVSIEAGVAV